MRVPRTSLDPGPTSKVPSPRLDHRTDGASGSAEVVSTTTSLATMNAE